MNGDTGTHERPTKRAKVDIACDTCRQRKTRCDGSKPICSLCENLSLNCVYRKPVEGGRTEDILRRLTHAEARLQALETGSPQANGHDHTQQRVNATTVQRVPHLHTAAAHKILHCWPRLRVKFTHPTIEPLKYLFTTGHEDDHFQDSFLEGIQNMNSNTLHALIKALRNHSEAIPSAIASLLQCTELFSTHGLTADTTFWDEHGRFEVHSCPPNLLLLLVVGVSFLEVRLPQGYGLPDEEVIFASVIQNSWKLYNKRPEEQIPMFLMIACILTYLFSLPLHATGILRYIGSLLSLPFMSEYDEVACKYARVHFMLESDIYSEIDGFPSTPEKFLRSESLYCHRDEDTTARLLDLHVRLRVFENDILSELYTPSKAYVHPDQIGQTVSRISRDLENWYRSLPLDLQFSRTNLHQSDDEPESWHQTELPQRYHKCEFLLNRPVFYFVLHEDMEQSASPPEIMAAHQGIRPWMRDACYTTVRSAMAILALRAHPRRHNNWCDNQLLLAAYLMTLQARLKPELSGLNRQFRDSDIDNLLNNAERVLSNASRKAVVDRRTVEIMRNVRQNVNTSLDNQSSPA